MSKIGISLFQTPTSSDTSLANRKSNFVNKDNFIISKKFESFHSAAIDVMLQGGDLIFSPKGNLWNVKTKTVLSDKDSVFGFNNVFPDTIAERYISAWAPLVYSKYAPFTGIKDPSYFVSLPSVTDKTMGGWLLYKESTPPQYYILYNPINRLDLNTSENPKALYEQYCNVIQFQDSGCYCNDFTNQKDLANPTFKLPALYCTYSALSGRAPGQIVQEALDGPNMVLGDKSQAWGNLKSQCGCISDLCKEFKRDLTQFRPEDLPNVAPFLPTTCPAVENISLTVCSSDLGTNGVKISGDVKITQNCAATTTTKTEQVAIKQVQSPEKAKQAAAKAKAKQATEKAKAKKAASKRNMYIYIAAAVVASILLVLIYRVMITKTL